MSMVNEKELVAERAKLEKRYKSLNYRLWIILGGVILLIILKLLR
jgi:hypothetical protein